MSLGREWPNVVSMVLTAHGNESSRVTIYDNRRHRRRSRRRSCRLMFYIRRAKKK